MKLLQSDGRRRELRGYRGDRVFGFVDGVHMNRLFGLYALGILALSSGQVCGQAYGPMDNRVGAPVGGPAAGAGLPDSRIDSRTDSRNVPTGAPAPQGYKASTTQCYKDGKVVDRAYCESDPFYRPDRVPGQDLYSLRCSNTNPNYNPVSNSYIGLDGTPRYCR